MFYIIEPNEEMSELKVIRDYWEFTTIFNQEWKTPIINKDATIELVEAASLTNQSSNNW